MPYACHLGHWDELPGLIDAVYERFGRLDVLVNNAGLSLGYESLSDVTEKLWDATFAVNLKGPFRLSVWPESAWPRPGADRSSTSAARFRCIPDLTSCRMRPPSRDSTS